MQAVATALKLNSLQVYQNWESGYNRPDAKQWGPLSELLGVNAAKLYGNINTGRADAGIDSQAVWPLVDAINSHLAEIAANMRLLTALCGRAVPDAKVEKAGFKKMGRKTKEREAA